MQLRGKIRGVSRHKTNEQGRNQPFAGVNLFAFGDLNQLEPPDGGFIGAIPVDFIQRGRMFQPAANIAHGQALVWGGPEGGIQGATELVEAERCKDDAWLLELQDEIREGCLSKDNFNFLHGAPTTVPGSWVGGAVTCGNAACRKLAPSSAGQVRESLVQRLLL